MTLVDAASFPPPRAAVSLYPGDVMHARLKPTAHRFRYRVFSILIDLTRLDEADQASAIFSVNRRNLVSFHESDHAFAGPLPPGSRLLDQIARVLKPADLAIDGGRVMLLCYPRVAGFVFNPLSIYFVYDAREALVALIYEVRNTFGERHVYIAPVAAGELGPAGLRQERAKLFYVSPFNGMEMTYRFRILPPGERVGLRILASDREGPVLAASFMGQRADLTTASLLKAFRDAPMLTAKVVGAIHWEALRLWRKGLRPYRRPAAPQPVSYASKTPELAP